MPTKTTFDCVEMKNRIQAERLAEYELRKGEFAVIRGLLSTRVKDSELMKIVGRNRRSEPRISKAEPRISSESIA